MRLAFITQDFPPSIGGIQTYSFELAERLSTLCEEFVVIAPGDSNDQESDQSLKYNVLRVNCRNTLIGFFAVKQGLEYLKKHKIDAVFHAQWQTMNFSKKGKEKGIVKHIICAAHGRELLFNPYLKVPLLGKWYNRHMVRSLSLVDSFICVSQFTADRLLDLGLTSKPIAVIGNGTNPDEYHPKDVNQLRESLGLKDKKVLVTLCRLVERKGIDTCLKAVAELVKVDKNIVYLIVGSGPDTNRLKQMVIDLGIDAHVKFLGRVPSTIDYYNLADVFLMPSRSILPDVEGFGITFLEANACGVPVIGSNSGGIPDAIEHGKSGYLIEEDNLDELVKYIEYLLANPSISKQMGQYGRERVKSTYNWDHCAEETYRIIDNAIGSE